MSLLAIDIGGTTIKYTLYNKGKLGDITSVKTPIDLESFYHCLSNIVEQAKKEHIIQGVAISSPGAVNKNTGVIEGASALPYIHGFNIQSELETLFALPVSIENDANCAALAEVAFGAAKGCTTALLLVLGTGVGGAVVIDGKVHHGEHLFGGEFGYMLVDDTQTFSTVGTTVSMARRYYKRTGEKLDAVEIFERAFLGETIACEEKAFFVHQVARGIFNLSYAFDPDIILIGGGVSQADWLIPDLTKELNNLKQIVGIAPFVPNIARCRFQNAANLMGATVDFLQKNKLS